MKEELYKVYMLGWQTGAYVKSWDLDFYDENHTINRVSLKTGELIDTDLIIIGIGVTPNTKLAKEIGINIGKSGAIQTNKYFETNIPHIYAIGDVAESIHHFPRYHHQRQL